MDSGAHDNVDHDWLRYADDFLMLFQYENEARKVMDTLKKRLGEFSLEVAQDETRILPMGRFKGAKEAFNFLGFTFFNARTRTGKYRLGACTSNKKLKANLQAARIWLKEQMHRPVAETMSLSKRRI